MIEYIRDGEEIYRRSFATIRAEANLSHVPTDLEKLAVRVVHASGMVDIVDDLVFSPGAGTTGRQALAVGAPILCDARMVAEGITRSRLPAGNAVICTLSDPAVPMIAKRIGNTRSAAALARSSSTRSTSGPSAVRASATIVTSDSTFGAGVAGAVAVPFVGSVLGGSVLAGCAASTPPAASPAHATIEIGRAHV